MNQIRPHSIRVFRSISCLAVALVMSACAPNLGHLPSIRPFSHYSTTESFKAPVTPWPSVEWWRIYNDEQLNQLMSEALKDSPDITIAQSRIKLAQAQAEEIGASALPSVSANASYASMRESYNNGIPANAVIKGWNDSARATLDFTYELDFWGRNRAALAAATSSLEAARADAAQAKVMLTTSLAAAYADLAQQFTDRDAAVEALKVRSRTSNLFAQRNSNGLENIGSVKQAQALENNARGEIAALDESICLTRNRIAALLGQGPDRGLSLTHPTLDLNRNFGLPADLPMEFLGHRPDVQAARLRTESAAARIKSAKAGFYPNVNLNAYIGQQVLGLKFLGESDSTIGSVGPAINLPLFNRGQLNAAYKTSVANYEEAVATYDSTLTHAFQDVANVAISRRSLDDRLKFAGQATRDAEKAWGIARKRYRAGLSNYLDVLTAEDTLITNRRIFASLQARAFTLDIDLMRALGGGYQPTLPSQSSTVSGNKE